MKRWHLLISLFLCLTTQFSQANIHYAPYGELIANQSLYGYDDQFLTHQPRVVYDTVASESYNLYWDLNGNLQEISNCKSEYGHAYLYSLGMNHMHQVVNGKETNRLLATYITLAIQETIKYQNMKK